MPAKLSGTTINVGTNQSGDVYTHRRVCSGEGELSILRFKISLKSIFDDAPPASIAKSVDNGVTWTWNTNALMFGTRTSAASLEAYKFTTIFFLDYGKDSESSMDGCVDAHTVSTTTGVPR